eukprot:5387431-Amphidinium_carterae.1
MSKEMDKIFVEMDRRKKQNPRQKNHQDGNRMRSRAGHDDFGGLNKRGKETGLTRLTHCLERDEVVREGFKSERPLSKRGLTPTMLPWIIEVLKKPVKETLETPHAGNLLNTLGSDTIDKYGRFLRRMK